MHCQRGGQPNGQRIDQPSLGGGRPGGGDRQLQAELQQRLGDAQELRRQLDKSGDLTRNLDQITESLKQLSTNYQDDTATAAYIEV